MSTINYYGKKVYTQSEDNVSFKDLKKAQTGVSFIDDVYFLEVRIDGDCCTAEFDETRVRKGELCLELRVESAGGRSSFRLREFKDVIGFINDMGTSLKTWSALAGKPVTCYKNSAWLIGLSTP
jgi:hypothetical protein